MSIKVKANMSWRHKIWESKRIVPTPILNLSTRETKWLALDALTPAKEPHVRIE